MGGFSLIFVADEDAGNTDFVCLFDMFVCYVFLYFLCLFVCWLHEKHLLLLVAVTLE